MRCNEPFKKKTSRSQPNSWLFLGPNNIKTNNFYVLAIHTMIQVLKTGTFTSSASPHRLTWQIAAINKVLTKYSPTGNAAANGRRQNYWMLIGQLECTFFEIFAGEWGQNYLLTISPQVA